MAAVMGGPEGAWRASDVEADRRLLIVVHFFFFFQLVSRSLPLSCCAGAAFKDFLDMGKAAFNALRRNGDLLITLFSLMVREHII